MKKDDIIVLTDRSEIEDLLEVEKISDKKWLEIKVALAKNKSMWQAIDEAIYEIVHKA